MLAIGAASKSEQYFHDLFSIFRVGTDYEIFVARKEGQMIAALLVLYHKNIIEYYVPVILSEHRGLQALSLIIYEAMRQNKPKGRTTWNWGGNGASLDSVYRFKKSWGAVDLPYRYFTKINKNIRSRWIPTNCYLIMLDFIYTLSSSAKMRRNSRGQELRLCL